MANEFAGKRILVTGGTSGIGRAVSEQFTAVGGLVTATGLTQREIDEFSQRVPAATVCQLDVTDAAAVAEVAARFDELDVLVHCAGTVARDGLEHDPLHFARIIDVNLTGAMRMCAAARPALARSRGCVVQVASMLSFFGSGHVPAYSASKGGLVQLVKSLAIAWADDGIRVNAVAPGWIETPLTQPLVDNEERRRQIIARTPLRRWGQPADVAGPVLFLCSPAAGFITGAVLPVDGGYLIA